MMKRQKQQLWLRLWIIGFILIMLLGIQWNDCIVAAADVSKESSSSSGTSNVIDLTDSNFDEYTSKGKWMLEFYAPFVTILQIQSLNCIQY